VYKRVAADECVIELRHLPSDDLRMRRRAP
jgi:hypothetical protein